MNLIGTALGGLLLALAAACPAFRSEAVEAAQRNTIAACTIQGTITLNAGSLEYSYAADASPQAIAATDAQPYQIVRLDSPALATTCGTDLTPCTIAIGPNGHISTYPDWVPMIAQNPLIVLIPMASSAVDTGLGVQLLGADGGSLYRNDNAALLPPASDTGWEAAYFLESSTKDDLIFVYGADPALIAVDPASGKQLWRANLDPPSKVADAQLWAELERQLLIALQYDYELFEFISVDRANGSVLQRWQLTGVPGGESVYPGPVWIPVAPELDGTRATVVVFDDTELAWQRWTFDCVSGGLVRQDCEPPETLREENELPVGGKAIPGPGNAPFPQRLLPAASGASWTIDALTDNAGQVLVVDGTGAHWVNVEGAR